MDRFSIRTSVSQFKSICTLSCCSELKSTRYIFKNMFKISKKYIVYSNLWRTLNLYATTPNCSAIFLLVRRSLGQVIFLLLFSLGKKCSFLLTLTSKRDLTNSILKVRLYKFCKPTDSWVDRTTMR